MRDFIGNRVSKVDEHGYAVGVDNVRVSTTTTGSFRVRYAANVDRVCVEVERDPGCAYMLMQLTVEQAMLLRDLVAAGVADAVAETAVESPAALPAGGDR